jgi:putative oxidoreductase
MKKFLFSCPATSFKSSLSLLLLRLVFGGGMLIGHGWGKLMNFSGAAESFPDPLGIGSTMSLLGAVLSETLFAALVTAGFLTRAAVIPLIFTMGVAAFIIHGGDPLFGPGPSKEMALLYMSTYIVILIGGPGKYSADAFLK